MIGNTQSKAARAHDSDHGGYFAGVTLTADRIIFGGQWQPLTGVSAAVSEFGGVDRRTTATRVVAGAVVAGKTGAIIGALARKKIDNREVTITISGPLYTWSVPVRGSEGRRAHAFVAKISTAAALA